MLLQLMLLSPPSLNLITQVIFDALLGLLPGLEDEEEDEGVLQILAPLE